MPIAIPFLPVVARPRVATAPLVVGACAAAAAALALWAHTWHSAGDVPVGNAMGSLVRLHRPELHAVPPAHGDCDSLRPTFLIHREGDWQPALDHRRPERETPRR